MVIHKLFGDDNDEENPVVVDMEDQEEQIETPFHKKLSRGFLYRLGALALGALCLCVTLYYMVLVLLMLIVMTLTLFRFAILKEGLDYYWGQGKAFLVVSVGAILAIVSLRMGVTFVMAYVLSLSEADTSPIFGTLSDRLQHVLKDL